MPLAEITVRFLELTRETLSPKRSDQPDVAFTKVDPPLPALNRYFYNAVGAQWYWLDRRPWSLMQWTDHLTRADVETWVLSENGTPAGYVEFERRGEGAVEIQYLGLLGEFIGRGLGAHLVTCAAERALAMGARTVLLNTCSLDHPQALKNYTARGFREVRTETKSKDLPATPPNADGITDVDDVRALVRRLAGTPGA